MGILSVTSQEGRQVAVVLAAAVALALLVRSYRAAWVSFSASGLQQLVEGFLYASAHKFLELPLDNFFV